MRLSLSTRGMWLLTLLAVLLTGWTTVTQARDRHRANFGDFSYLQAGSKCLIARCDPYFYASLNKQLATQHEQRVYIFPMSPVYPTSTLMVLLPFAALRWPLAAFVYTGLGGLLTALACGLMIHRFRLRIWDPPVLIFVALLTTTPFSDAIDFGNPVVLVTALTALACLLLLRDAMARTKASDTLAWILLGLALALKPQLAAGPALVLFCRPESRRPAFKAGSLAIGLLLFGLAAYRMRLGSFHFLTSLRWAVGLSVMPEGSSDFANFEASDFLNIQTTFAAIPHLSRAAINTLAWTITAALAGATACLAARTDALKKRPWTIIALALAISLLPVYHRGYDRVSALLLIPAAAEIGATRKGLAWVYCALVAFWIANDTLMAHAIRRWRYKPQSPAEDVIFCLLLLTTLLWTSPARTPSTSRLDSIDL